MKGRRRKQDWPEREFKLSCSSDNTLANLRVSFGESIFLYSVPHPAELPPTLYVVSLSQLLQAASDPGKEASLLLEQTAGGCWLHSVWLGSKSFFDSGRAGAGPGWHISMAATV